VVTGVALMAAGGLWLLHVLGVPLRWEVLLPSALIAIGLAVLVGGRRSGDGRAGDRRHGGRDRGVARHHLPGGTRAPARATGPTP
jgi:hypothetical protein